MGATGAAIISSPASETMDFLRDLATRHGLTQDITLHTRRIQPDFNAKHKRESMTTVRKNFGPRHGFFSVTLPTSEDASLHELKRMSNQHQSEPKRRPVDTVTDKDIDPTVLKLPLPGPPELPDHLDGSALLFGTATTYSRLVASNASLLHDWARWLTDGQGRSNGAGLLLVLHRASASEVGHVSSKVRELGIDATVTSSGMGEVVGGSSPDSDSTWIYLELVGQLARHAREITSKNKEVGKSERRKEKKYLGLMDDDVFFPSMNRLLARLGQLDPAKDAYVGLPSEKADWAVTEGANVTTTYGGGAVFLTRPMADAISKMPCARQLPEQPPTTSGQWDERLYQCIMAHHNSRLRIMSSFYTPEDDNDNENDDDSYESGLQPLKLHHCRQRHQRFSPSRAHLITSLTGEGSFLQRFWFRGDDWILVNGHSVAEYPDGVDVVPPSKASRRKSPPVLITQQPQDLIYDTDKNDIGTKDEIKISKSNIGRGENGAVDGRLASRITIDSDAAQKQERKGKKVVTWTGVKRIWRHLDSKIVRDEAGAVKEVWQAYAKRAGAVQLEHDHDGFDPSDTVHREDGVSNLDSVILLIWERPS